MEYYSEHSPRQEKIDVEGIMSLLYSMKRSKQNHALLTEYFLHEFAINPSFLVQVLKKIKVELHDQENIGREKLARRYLHVFSFLCERFGLYEDKLELDDICFAINHPEEYKRFKKELSDYQKSSSTILKDVKSSLEEEIKNLWIKFQIKGRYKNLYSIYKKCEKKKIKKVLWLWDLFAFRIIIDDDTSVCYDVLNVLHDTFIPLPERFKDYISIPKINGYQSIHTWLIGISEKLDIAIEAQIRTKVMDDIAESGIAAHFLYSKNKTSHLVNEKEQKLINHLEEVAESISQNPSIYCLSPAWDILRLNRGSTVKDFAHKVHSGLPKKARYALVNNDKKDLDYTMKNFDTVRIVTS